MSAKALWICACAVCLILGQYPAAGSGDLSAVDQTYTGEQSSIIRVSSSLVTLPVSVTDPEGQAVHNLGIQDFLVEEDGRTEAVSRMAEAGRSPLRLALLLDLSGSVNARFDFEQHAAVRFLERVWRQGDMISIIAFADRSRILLKTSGLLSDALKVLSDLEPTEHPTAFFDAIVLSTRVLRQSAGSETRQAIIALSDGEDNRSVHTLSEALREIQRADATFYSINPAGSSIRLNEMSLRAQSEMKLLADETGGNAFVSSSTANLDDFFSKIAADLRAQYLLSYYSTHYKRAPLW